MPARFRNVSGDDRRAFYGVIGPKLIPADGLLTVRDEVAPNYECQPDIWRRELGDASTTSGARLGPAPKPAGEGSAATPREA